MMYRTREPGTKTLLFLALFACLLSCSVVRGMKFDDIPDPSSLPLDDTPATDTPSSEIPKIEQEPTVIQTEEIIPDSPGETALKEAIKKDPKGITCDYDSHLKRYLTYKDICKRFPSDVKDFDRIIKDNDTWTKAKTAWEKTYPKTFELENLLKEFAESGRPDKEKINNYKKTFSSLKSSATGDDRTKFDLKSKSPEASKLKALWGDVTLSKDEKQLIQTIKLPQDKDLDTLNNNLDEISKTITKYSKIDKDALIKNEIKKLAAEIEKLEQDLENQQEAVSSKEEEILEIIKSLPESDCKIYYKDIQNSKTLEEFTPNKLTKLKLDLTLAKHAKSKDLTSAMSERATLQENLEIKQQKLQQAQGRNKDSIAQEIQQEVDGVSQKLQTAKHEINTIFYQITAIDSNEQVASIKQNQNYKNFLIKLEQTISSATDLRKRVYNLIATAREKKLIPLQPILLMTEKTLDQEKFSSKFELLKKEMEPYLSQTDVSTEDKSQLQTITKKLDKLSTDLKNKTQNFKSSTLRDETIKDLNTAAELINKLEAEEIKKLTKIEPVKPITPQPTALTPISTPETPDPSVPVAPVIVPAQPAQLTPGTTAPLVTALEVLGTAQVELAKTLTGKPGTGSGAPVGRRIAPPVPQSRPVSN